MQTDSHTITAKAVKLPEAILSILKSVYAPGLEFVPLHEPSFAGNEREYVTDCINSSFVSSVGNYVNKYEKLLAGYTGVKHAVAVVSGTSALHVSLLLANVRQNDEVLVPALTFVASANAVSYLGAIPHFVESEEKTLGFDPHILNDYLCEIGDLRKDGCFNKRTGRRIRAAIAVHIFGHPVDLDPLKEVCDRFGLELIEDAAESLGSFYKGKHTGHWGRLSILSFNGNKIVTTGGGGAILTNDAKLGKLAKHLTTTARLSHKWEFYHNQVGFNYRMPGVNAALGCAQLEQIQSFLQSKRKLAMRYADAFADLEGVRFFSEQSFVKSNYWLNVLLLEPEYEKERERVLELTNSHGIQTRPVWTLMHKLPMYKDCPRMELKKTEALEARIVNLPSSANLYV